MSDKPSNKEQIWGCSWNDPKPRMSGTLHLGGLTKFTGPTDGMNPAKDADGEKIPRTDNIKSNT